MTRAILLVIAFALFLSHSFAALREDNLYINKTPYTHLLSGDPTKSQQGYVYEGNYKL